MIVFIVGLALLIAVPWGGCAISGCNAKMESMRAELEVERTAYEKDAERRREAVREEIAGENRKAEEAMARRKEALRRELDAKRDALSAEVAHLEKANEIHDSDRKFRNVVGRNLAAEYREYQMIGSDLAFARKSIGETESVLTKIGKAPSDELRGVSGKIAGAQSDLDEIGRSIREAAALFQLEENQFSQ